MLWWMKTPNNRCKECVHICAWSHRTAPCVIPSCLRKPGLPLCVIHNALWWDSLRLAPTHACTLPGVWEGCRWWGCQCRRMFSTSGRWSHLSNFLFIKFIHWYGRMFRGVRAPHIRHDSQWDVLEPVRQCPGEVTTGCQSSSFHLKSAKRACWMSVCHHSTRSALQHKTPKTKTKASLDKTEQKLVGLKGKHICAIKAKMIILL